MNIAYTMSNGRGDTDLLLYAVAKKLAKLGYRTAGLTQINTERTDDCRCDMDVKVLPDGPTIRISQNLGAGAKGCRLDPSALEKAVELTNQQLEKGADVLIINKFGKHEAEGRGFRETIASAMLCGLPILVGANRLNLGSLLEFTGNEAVRIEDKEDKLLRWMLAQLPNNAFVA